MALRMTGAHLQTGGGSEVLWALCCCYTLCQGKWETPTPLTMSALPTSSSLRRPVNALSSCNMLAPLPFACTLPLVLPCPCPTHHVCPAHQLQPPQTCPRTKQLRHVRDPEIGEAASTQLTVGQGEVLGV